MKKIIALIIFVGLIGYTIYTAAFSNDSSSSSVGLEKAATSNDSPSSSLVGLEKGNLAPDFELVTFKGEKMKLSDFRGKKVMLNFWASWCGPCRSEMPDMQKVHKQNKGDFVILAVNAFQTERSKEAPEEFIKELGLTFPILMDEKGKISDMYQVVGLPTTFFIDTNGKIQDKHIGVLTKDQIVKAIENLN